MIDKRVLLEFVRRQFGEYKETGSDVQVNCPFCARHGKGADRSFKLWISFTRDAFHCFRCDAKGRTSRLFPQLSTYGTYCGEDKRNNETLTPELEPLPDSCLLLRELPQGHLARSFIEARGFRCDDGLDKRVLFCCDYRKGNFSFGPRLIFPIYQTGTYRGFQGRCLDGNEPKYIGATGMRRKTILYNYDEAFSQSEELVIVEGFFDQWKVGRTAVAAMGKAVSDEQLRLIRLGTFKRVVVLLDKDAKQEVKKTASKIAPFFSTFVGFLPVKDPGEMTNEQLRHFLTYNIERAF